MGAPRRAAIHSIRDYFPEKRLTNADLEKMVDTNDQWIRERTGILERRIGEKHETPSYMGTQAALKLFKDHSIDPLSIDCVVCATVTPDYVFPASACLIQNNLGLKNAFAFDLSAACSGYLYALETARAFVESGIYKRVLVIAAEKMSSIIDYTDRQTCIIFGDAGSATLVEEAKDSQSYIIGSYLRSDGSGCPYLFMPAGGSASPATAATVAAREHSVRQEGKQVFKRAVVDMAEACENVLKAHGFKASDVDLFVPHQANMRIIENVGERLGISKERTAINIDRFGNTTAATIPTAMLDAQRQGKMKKGMLVMLGTFGAGFTWGATLLRI